MGYSTNNKFRVYAEDATTETSKINGIVYTDDGWEGLAERRRGAKEGIAKSQEFNTALRQSSLMSTILSEIIVRRYGNLISTDLGAVGYSDFENYIESLAEKFNKTNFLLSGEVLTKHISDSQITTAKLVNGSVTKTKLNSDILNGTFNNMTVGNAIKSTQDGNGNNIADTYATKTGNYSGLTAGNSKKVNDIEITKDGNGVLKIGDIIIPQKKLLWSGNQLVNDASGEVTISFSETLNIGDIVIIEVKGTFDRVSRFEKFKIVEFEAGYKYANGSVLSRRSLQASSSGFEGSEFKIYANKITFSVPRGFNYSKSSGACSVTTGALYVKGIYKSIE